MDENADLSILVGLMEQADQGQNGDFLSAPSAAGSNTSCLSTGNSTFYSTVENLSVSSTSQDLDLDQTIGQAPPTPQGRSSKKQKRVEKKTGQEQMDEEAEYESLKARLAEMEQKRQMRMGSTSTTTSSATAATSSQGSKVKMVDLDFTQPVAAAQSKKQESAVHNGDTSSSEDEQRKNAESGLNSDGRAMKHILKKKKMAIEEKRGLGVFNAEAKAHKNSPSKMMLQEMRQRAVETGRAVQNQDKDCDVYDTFFRICVKNVKVPSAAFRSYADGQTQLRIGQLDRMGNASLPADWLTMGVIVVRGQCSKSSAGNEYVLWQLHDLSDCSQQPIRVMLFGDAYKRHWKLDQGTVVAVFNAQAMQSQTGGGPGGSKSSHGKSAATFRVFKSTQIVDLGTSSAFGHCLGKIKKDNSQCQNFVNSKQGHYCVYHLNAATRVLTARRGEFRVGNTQTNKVPSWQNKITADKQLMFYGGQSIAAPAAVPAAKKALFNHRGAGTSSGQSVLSTNKPGPITMEQIRTQRMKLTQKDCTTSIGPDSHRDDLLSRLQRPTMASRQLLKTLKEVKKPDGMWQSISTSSANVGDKSVRSFMTAIETSLPPATRVRAQPIYKNANGRSGLQQSPAKRAAYRAKLSAIRTVRASGPLLAADPNAPFSKRKHEHTNTQGQGSAASTSELTNQLEAVDLSPVKKRSRLSQLNMSPASLRALANSKTKHDHLADQVDREREDKYFKVMQAKELVEEKLCTTTKIKDCNVITCKKCAYTWHVQSSYCKQQGHLLIKHKADKRFFKCTDCKQRTVCYDKYPKTPCNKCGSSSFVSVGMKDERKGVVSEELQLKVRGEELPSAQSL